MTPVVVMLSVVSFTVSLARSRIPGAFPIGSDIPHVMAVVLPPVLESCAGHLDVIAGSSNG